MQASHQARLVLSAEPPYGITYTNEAWTVLMGHSAEQAKMFPFTLMNVSQVKRRVEAKVPAAAVCCLLPASTLLNMTSGGRVLLMCLSLLLYGENKSR